MLKKYITKHFKIYKVEPKMPSVFKIYDYQMQEEVSEWTLNNYLSKIFSVDIMLVKKVFKDMAKEELARLRNAQHSIQFEDHEGDNN
jgi:hypothetical protein